MNLFFSFIPNLYLNLFLVFFVSYFLVEFFIVLFKVRSTLWQYTFRTLPFLKLIIDPFQYRFSNWTLFHHMTLLNQPPNAKFLNATATFSQNKLFYNINFFLDKNHLKFGLLDLLFEKTKPNLPMLLTGLILLICLLKIIVWICDFFKEIKADRPLSEELPFELISTQLLTQLKKKRVKVLLSQKSNFSPYAKFLPKKKIILPKNIREILSIDEINAVIAHELKHLAFFHLLFFTYLSLMKCLFWFVPTQKVSLSLEKLCDQYAMRLQKTSTHIMNALVKVARASSLKKKHVFQFTSAFQLHDRIYRLATFSSQSKKSIYILYCAIFLILFSIISFSSIFHF